MAKIHYISFPVTSLQQVGAAKVRCVVSFPKFHYNDLLSTSWQEVVNFPVYGEVAAGKRV